MSEENKGNKKEKEEKKKGIHEGHRERVRDKILANGIKDLPAHEVLEYVLFSFIPRKNTNEIAHELINKFGSFADVLLQDADRLMTVKGMTKNAAIFISMLPELFRLFVQQVERPHECICGKGEAKMHILSKAFGKKAEEFYVACLDARDNLIKVECLSKGCGDSVAVSARAVTEFALRTGAVSVIIAHNHPSGGLTPTEDDILFTRNVLWTLDGIGVELRDHFVVHDEDVYSFADDGLIEALSREKALAMALSE